ncbi:MAG: ferritin-like domain-containing protein, partial [Bdellovibrionota bacterium]
MAMDLEKMLERCHKGQWNVSDFDWSKKPIPLSKEKEIKVCSYYANMEYIERLAGALFLSLSKRFEDPTLRGIYETFVADEIRHSHAAARLMDYFDVHHYQIYSPSPFLLRFMPYFTRAIESLNPAFANAYILGGELVLDIALLRSLNEYVDDPLSQAVVDKINQDESRHLAMDYFMAEYCSKNRMGRFQGDKKKFWQNLDFWGVTVWGPPF